MNFNISLYPVFVGVACGSGISYYVINSKENLKEKIIYSLITLVFSFICAKLFFLISLPDYASSIVHYMSFINGGGYVFYGGLLGGIFISYILKNYSRYYHSKGLVPAICLGHGIGRIGCYLTGCCFGIKLGDWIIPVQLIESLSLFLMFMYFHIFKEKINNELSKYLLYYAALRFFLEFFRGDIHRGIYLNFSTSQWVSIIIILLVTLGSKRKSFRI